MPDESQKASEPQCECGICKPLGMTCQCEACRLERSEGWAVIGLAPSDAGDSDGNTSLAMCFVQGHGDAGDSDAELLRQRNIVRADATDIDEEVGE